jgi:hypothetical protein
MGSGFGVGGEDGRSDGGAVRVLVARRFPRAGAAGVAFVVVVSISSFFASACSRQKAQQPPDATTLLQAVAPADPAKLPSPEQSKQWSNPYLVIRPQVVGLLSGAAANEEQILKPEEVVKALAALPVSAWPYGRAVAILVDAKRTSSEEDKIALRRNRGIVAGELQSAHVAIQWIPSS